TIRNVGIPRRKRTTRSPGGLRSTWSESMKIRRPSKPEVPFKRKRSPPPQATKLLRYSLLSGLVFMVLLAIVFLPRMFPDQPPIEIVNPTNQGKLRFETTGD